MLAPDVHTEKGISIYSTDISGSISKTGIDIKVIFYKKGSILSLFKTIPSLRNFDIVHIQHEYGLFGNAGMFFTPFILFLGLLKKGKLVVTMHTVISMKEKLYPDLFWWTWLKRKLIYPLQNKLIGTLSSKIVTHTRFLSEILIRDYGIDKNKLVVIKQGVKEKVPRLNKDRAKSELKLSGNVYLVMGVMSQQKGTDIIVKQAKKIGKTIVLAGHFFKLYPEYVKEIQDYIKNNNLAEFVKFETRKMDSKDRLWWIYFSAADIVIMPYRRMTTSSIFVDAMSARKPVISSDKKFFREIQRNFKCVKIAKNNQDYPKLIMDTMKPEVLAKMERECERYVKENGLSIVGEKYKALYESII